MGIDEIGLYGDYCSLTTLVFLSLFIEFYLVVFGYVILELLLFTTGLMGDTLFLAALDLVKFPGVDYRTRAAYSCYF